MPALRDVQAAFRDGLLAGDPRVLGLIAGGRLPPAARLQIHRNNLQAGLTGALAAHFPVVERLVGAAFFAGAARRFIAAAPPRDPCLSAYGHGFADFLAGFAPAAALPWLADLARLEWSLHEVRQTAAEPALTLAALAALPPPALGTARLTLQPAIRHLASPHAVDVVWHANQPARDGAATLDADARWLEIRRDADGDVVIARLDGAAFAFRAALARGGSLAAATDAALTTDPLFDLPGALHRLFNDALVIGIAAPDLSSPIQETGHDD